MTGNVSFAAYLRELRIRLNPATLGYTGARRRTPGLRREEVAQRAGMSATWYSWLEQGRGGAPSAEALDRLAAALLLSDAEREHLFLLGLGRPPEVRYQPSAGVTPRLQRVLDAMGACPALIRTATWDVMAWNRAASAVLCDYGALPPDERNVLSLLFLDSRRRKTDPDWERNARNVVGAFRGEAARTGVTEAVQPLVDKLCAKSSDFAAMWRDTEIRGGCESQRRLLHPMLGELTFEFTALAVDGRPELMMLLYTPLSAEAAARIAKLMAA